MKLSASRLVVVAAAATLVMSARPSTADKPDLRDLQPGRITVQAERLNGFNKANRTQTVFGTLEFRGGLVLRSDANPHFGGWSGLITDQDGREILAVSDSGAWLMATLRYDGSAPVGLDDAHMGPLRTLSGGVLSRRRDRDAEAVALVSGRPHQGMIQVAFERNYRVAQYAVGNQDISKTRQLLEKPKSARDMKSNSGFEAMSVLRGGPYRGRTVAMSERLYSDAGHHTGWIWTASGPREFNMTNIGDFDVTDMASSEDGFVYVLERRFRWLEGVHMRIRRIPVENLKPGALVAGEVLIETDLDFEIDNMEALAVARGASGETLLTLMSDDNFNNILQRNVLLQFAVRPTRKNAKARQQE